MTQVNDAKAFVEPSGEKERAGLGTWKVARTPYDHFMEAQGLPIHRGLGMYDIREIPKSP